MAVPVAVRTAVAEAVSTLHSSAADVRWTAPASWHLTVAFLGGTDAGPVEPLTTCLRRVASSFEPFTVRLRTSAERGSRRSVPWIGLEPSEPLTALAGAVRTALREFGLPCEDHAFRPHLTLARARGRASIPRALADAYRGPAATWTVPGLELVRSHLGRAGARHETLSAVPFPA